MGASIESVSCKLVLFILKKASRGCAAAVNLTVNLSSKIHTGREGQEGEANERLLQEEVDIGMDLFDLNEARAQEE